MKTRCNKNVKLLIQNNQFIITVKYKANLIKQDYNYRISDMSTFAIEINKL